LPKFVHLMNPLFYSRKIDVFYDQRQFTLDLELNISDL